ncbi:hypothetical protein [Oricola sp.]|uniref:hypothetical protein n=1 Tax=Oricola sp. TaxID=1979950 RepID=UPI0025CCBCAF|nr:hypothetical protein [Oricola sp.]MCI5075647.1 hypothetical protein [Oricola sp.]
MRVLGNGRIRRKGEGVSYGSGANIKQLCDWDYATSDDVATVETAGHFNDMADVMQVGEIIDARLDLDGTPVFMQYMCSANDGTNVAIIRTADLETAGGGARAVVPTADGLTTGLILPGDRLVEATSADANHILTLPLATAATRDREIHIWVAPSTNCELRTPADSDQTINNVNSDGTNEALLTHTQLYICRQHLATGWLLQAFTALGAVATAIVPD